MKIHGIHHISSIVGDAQRDYDFYTSLLGLRLVKQTLNYEDKDHYHLYYGNENASSGIVTTFPMNKPVPGRIGDGQVALTSYGLNLESFPFWKKRFDYFNIDYREYTRFGLKRLAFQDPSGLKLEFIESKHQDPYLWSTDDIQVKDAFRGIDRATLYSSRPEDTMQLLIQILNYELVNENETYYLLKTKKTMGGYLELLKVSHGFGQIAMGSVHHIALGVENGSLDLWKELLEKNGYHPGEIKDRHYFKSLYFKDKGGIIFELATQGPGLLIDETLENLGDTFIIPDHFKKDKDEIFTKLKPLKLNNIKKTRR